jgi:hypothetical protein
VCVGPIVRTMSDMPSRTFIVDHPGMLAGSGGLCELVTAVLNSIGEKPGEGKP